jgi:hypothetical protein
MAALVLILVIAITAFGGDSNDEPNTDPSELGIQTTPDNLGGSSDTTTDESTDTSTSTTVEPVAPVTPAPSGDTSGGSVTPETPPATTPQPEAPSGGAGGGAVAPSP